MKQTNISISDKERILSRVLSEAHKQYEKLEHSFEDKKLSEFEANMDSQP